MHVWFRETFAARDPITIAITIKSLCAAVMQCLIKNYFGRGVYKSYLSILDNKQTALSSEVLAYLQFSC